MAQFARPLRTRWEQTAKEASLSIAGEHSGVSASWTMVDLSADLDCEPLLGELRGCCGSTVIARERRVWWLRKMMDGAWSVEFEKDGKVTRLSRVLFVVSSYLCVSWYFFCVFHVLFIYYFYLFLGDHDEPAPRV
jgi:hypothetical protein